jgi:hypothetical protein
MRISRHALLLVFVLGTSCGVEPKLTGSGGVNGSTAGGNPGDLPCDVQAVLDADCTSCHGNPPSGGAPMALERYADLAAPGTGGVSIAQRAWIRMTSTTTPMPPAPASPVPAADVATFKAWLDAGMPMGSCGTSDPFAGPPTCTSGTYWTGGEGSSRMHPGVACIACHAQTGGEAPRYTIAGTVYPTGHEPDNCNGEPGGATVVITDANDATYTLTVNSAGNFSSRLAVAFPIRAKVVQNGNERVMATPQSTGDCNTCHTQDGASSAPGRIVTP